MRQWTEREFAALTPAEKAAFPIIFYCAPCGGSIPEANLIPLKGKRTVNLAVPIGHDVGRCRWHQTATCAPVVRVYQTTR